MVRRALEDYLALEYPFNVIADPDGGYVITFPDLPGCVTVAETIEEIGPMAEDARVGWIETAYEQGLAIPLPSYPEEYSGKFNLRLPRSLHRRLAQAAERDGVSLNTLVIGWLERAQALPQATDSLDERLTRIEARLAGLSAQLANVQESLRYQSTQLPQPSARQERFRVVKLPVAV